MRSKQGIDNTYNLPDVINKFPWNLSIINQDLLNEVTKLINIKKEEKFSEYKYSKIIQKDRYTKIIFEKYEAKFNLYLKLKKETATVDIQNEILLYCNSKKVLDKYLLVKDVIITKTIK